MNWCAACLILALPAAPSGGLASSMQPWLAPDVQRRLVPVEGDAVDGALHLARRAVMKANVWAGRANAGRVYTWTGSCAPSKATHVTSNSILVRERDDRGHV